MWISFDGQYTQQKIWDAIPHTARWLYHAIVETCVGGGRWDGELPLRRALGCSDVPDPEGDLDTLIAAELITSDGIVARVVYIDQHIPPEGQRPAHLLPRKKANQAEYRKRNCEAGDHSKDCPAKTCPVKVARRAGALPRALPVTPGRSGAERSGEGASTDKPSLEEGAEVIPLPPGSCEVCRNPPGWCRCAA